MNVARFPGEAEAFELRELDGQYPVVSIHRLDVTKPEDIRTIIWKMEEIKGVK